ncbi:helix-turn-helix protein [Sporomusa ovata DSM 2662]|uniref:HTH cro/C1-type domain-containing protein n=1 Tax=Sporomusa ovata TaxID=2378 RepID=A0A0U1L0Y6_9FIRM|nr:helix-turn-helix transcriptional regulator [Sporomusa ovata]EQB27502.1 plasmid maintenance system antidote protein [Sporomusa ovata DSM 2662]CQR73348.1 hypothetical protein SpAn4DRAFT_2580 [Sporomusa ovata]
MKQLKDVTLQEMLEQANIKQREVASLLELHESTVSLKVSGKREISLHEAGIIAERLQTSTDQIKHAIDFAKCKVHKSDQPTLPRTG